MVFSIISPVYSNEIFLNTLETKTELLTHVLPVHKHMTLTNTKLDIIHDTPNKQKIKDHKP